jgi:hypothetical protein
MKLPASCRCLPRCVGEPPTRQVISFVEISSEAIMNALTTCWREVGVS